MIYLTSGAVPASLDVQEDALDVEDYSLEGETKVVTVEECSKIFIPV